MAPASPHLLAAALGAEVGPAYAASLEAIMGPDALSRLLDDVAAHEVEMVQLARQLFAAWLDRVVGPAMQVAAAGGVTPAG